MDTWPGWRLLHVECPIAIREEVELWRKRGVMDFSDFRRRATSWETALKRQGTDIELEPGDVFAPALWDVPSIPSFDIFWSISDIILSDRFRVVLESSQVTGATFHPVTLHRMGVVEPTTPPPSLSELEVMDDYFAVHPCKTNPSGYGSFFEMDVRVRTKPSFATDNIPVHTCETCGRTTIEESPEYKKRNGLFRSRKQLPIAHVPNVDIFWSHIYPSIIVSDRVRAIMKDAYLLNAEVTQLTIVEGY